MVRYLIVSLLLIIGVISNASAAPQWLTLNPTPTLPSSKRTGYAPVNGVHIWYAVYGTGEPVILLHGGLANSNYWGNQVPVLAQKYMVIVMDSRGHGRSTRNKQPFGYSLMASDVLALMDYLNIKKAAIVGWSDGGIIGLDIAINHPERITKLFAFGANSDPSGTNDPSKTVLFKKYITRTKYEYQKLSPSPNQYDNFLNEINKMWMTQPNFTKEQLNHITIPTWIVDGDHDESIKRENTEFMAAQIPNAGLLIQPQVGHFSFMQDPEQFNKDVLHFLEHVK